jgi:organic radical activating enzyme
MMNGSSNVYPITEIFTSFQGEGCYAGQVQTFIRLAGCTVGKQFPKHMYQERYSTDTTERPLHLPIYTEQCTLYDGRKFACDTDYRVKERLTARQIMEEIPKNVKNVCISGGEPLMHDLDTLITYLWDAKKKVHIETSGTIDKYLAPEIWVTVSPKFNVYWNMLRRADEVKILVDKDFSPTKPIETLRDGIVQVVSLQEIANVKPLFIQPVNGENTVDENNLKKCVELQLEYTDFRLSPQMHKVVGTQIGELVR